MIRAKRGPTRNVRTPRASNRSIRGGGGGGGKQTDGCFTVLVLACCMPLAVLAVFVLHLYG
jgi:hypothetical protein